MTKNRNRNRLRHWYRLFVGECPVCGRDQSYRERVYGPRPRKRSDRIVHIPDVKNYCGCMGV